jgi:3-oxoacyl-[acyl-carrier-protein] synthase II
MAQLSSPRVVVTGLGLLSPLGIGTAQNWKSLLAGKSGIQPITHFDVSAFRTRIAGQVSGFFIGDFDDRRFENRFDRFVNFALAAARMAVEDSKLDTSLEAERVAVIIGNALGGMLTVEKTLEALADRSRKSISPFFVPGTLGSMAASLIAIRLGAKGPCHMINGACASGANAIGCALELIRNGKADVVLAGGTEAALTPMMFHGYHAMKATSARNESPEKASRPFDRLRDGFVPGEGAAVMVLEALSSAVRRNASVYAELAGYGASCDAHHITGSDPLADGAARCMRAALREGGMMPDRIDCINAHGTSTPQNDSMETRAIKQVFGTNAGRVPVTANKSMTGHMIGASGAAEAVFSVLSIKEGIIPPTINLENFDPDCDLDYVSQGMRNVRMHAVLSNSFGFGGINASLLFRAWSENPSS